MSKELETMHSNSSELIKLKIPILGGRAAKNNTKELLPAAQEWGTFVIDVNPSHAQISVQGILVTNKIVNVPANKSIMVSACVDSPDYLPQSQSYRVGAGQTNDDIVIWLERRR